MAVPKRRRSKAKKRMNKANWKINIPTMSICSHCGEMHLSHNACTVCGFYNGKKVLKIKDKKTTKTPSESGTQAEE